MSRDGWVEIAAYLRPEQAGMLQGLLRSAGIEPLLENVASAGLNLEALGGARVLVHAEDAERASEIYRASGVSSASSAPANDREEIPDEEWSRSTPEEVDRAGPSVEPAGPDADDRSAASPWTRSGRFLLRFIAAIFRLLR